MILNRAVVTRTVRKLLVLNTLMMIHRVLFKLKEILDQQTLIVETNLVMLTKA